MPTIAQRELRNRSGEVLRRAERGTCFVVTVDGRPVAQLGPLPRAHWVSRAALTAILRTTGGDPSLMKDLAKHGDKLTARHDPWAPPRRVKRAR